MTLITLPPEIFQIILAYLDLDSIKAVRLASQKLAARCVGPRFLAFIQQPTLDVSLHNLRSLHAGASHPLFRERVHTLTLVATSFECAELEKILEKKTRSVHEAHGMIMSRKEVRCSPEELSEVRSSVEWLKEQQKARDTESPDDLINLLESVLRQFGSLDAIQLDAAVIVGPKERKSPVSGEWHPLWMRASHVFYLILVAMGRSGVSVKRLDAYRNTRRCSIPSGDITSYVSCLSSEQLKTLGGSLESLELSMSTEIEKEVEDDEIDEINESTYMPKAYLSSDDPRAGPADGTPGIALLLESARNLRRLNLHFRYALIGDRLHSYDRIVEAVAQVQLPLLKECSLSGFMSAGESLLGFLRKHTQLVEFKLEECRLTSGSWTPIFGHLSQAMPELENVHLSNLNGNYLKNAEYQQNDSDFNADEEEGEERSGIVNLYPIWDTSELDYRSIRAVSYSCGGGYCFHTRSFGREDLKKGLVFRPRPGGPKGSPQLAWWMRKREALYGPP